MHATTHRLLKGIQPPGRRAHREVANFFVVYAHSDLPGRDKEREGDGRMIALALVLFQQSAWKTVIVLGLS